MANLEIHPLIEERVYYKDNGPDDTGVVVERHSRKGIAVRWDVDGTADWYDESQLVWIS